MEQARVGFTARALGFAGLLPQIAAVVFVLAGHRNGGIDVSIAHGIGQALAFGYGALILSFLGGMWWSVAMLRGAGQQRLAIVAVLPSLVAGGLALALAATGAIRWCLVALGCVILLTLLVDRHLADRGEAPAGWMALRVPLSIGLGGLTILAGAVSGGTVTHF
ncbi:DUF3429 domain-containing protein [Sphingomonas aracearum]|uniref:DUF3429 family protein n=1 Tax=Sphingomonas aracearum TaxID=2283317 RepID=A0A369VR92_9SPHN|nr:DUF3429 domain-containing protein [Sphingomonas aracearum]RDE04543.1 DUF3429 family protein [Sphingomonas aracearum]